MKALLVFAALCQMLMVLEAGAGSFFAVIMSDGALGHPSALQMTTAATVALVPFLLIASGPFVLLRDRRFGAWIYLLVLDLTSAATAAYLLRSEGRFAVEVVLPAVLASVFVLFLRPRFNAPNA